MEKPPRHSDGSSEPRGADIVLAPRSQEGTCPASHVPPSSTTEGQAGSVWPLTRTPFDVTHAPGFPLRSEAHRTHRLLGRRAFQCLIEMLTVVSGGRVVNNENRSGKRKYHQRREKKVLTTIQKGNMLWKTERDCREQDRSFFTPRGGVSHRRGSTRALRSGM